MKCDIKNKYFFFQLFIKSNQGDEETTKVNYLTFIGTPVQATNMNDFKRVSFSMFYGCLVYLQWMLWEKCVFSFLTLKNGKRSDNVTQLWPKLS